VSLYPLIRPLAFALDAETAHRLTIKALKIMPPRRPPDFPTSLGIRVAGIDFPTPVGLAAGFDKDAEVAEQMLSQGFGFVEVGTLTPRPQDGNPNFSAIFYHDDEQKEAAIKSKEERDRSGRYRRPIVTEITPATEFYMAEDYHQQYLEKRGLSSCHIG
jgi:hypothetical protein